MRYRLLLLFLLFATAAGAQVLPEDTVKVRYATRPMIDQYYDSLLVIDTTMELIHRYDPFEHSPEPFTRTGPFGSPAFPLTWTPVEVRFRSGLNNFVPYFDREETVKYYNTFTPYTILEYVQGSRELQVLSALFTQNITPGWNFGGTVKTGGSNGFYFNQGTRLSKIRAWTRAQSRNQRYQLLANMGWHTFRTTESGGILDPTLFDSLPAFQRPRAEVWLDEAYKEEKHLEVFLKQYYYLGSYKKRWDPQDSVVKQRLFPQFHVAHSFNYHRQRHQYIDAAPPEAFYGQFLDDTTGTNDSITFHTWRNRLELSTGPYRTVSDTSDTTARFERRKWHWQASLQHAYHEARGLSLDWAQNSLSVHSQLRVNLDPIEVRGEGDFYLLGYMQGNFNLAGSLRSRLWRGWYAEGEAQWQRVEPPFITQYYSSNHFRWLNEFVPTNVRTLSGQIGNDSANVSLHGTLLNLTNYTYFGDEREPRQYGGDINYVRLWLEKDFRFGKFASRNLLIWQQELQTDLLRLPQVVLQSNFYFSDYFFKGAVLARLGVELSYFTAYEPGYYLPSIGQLALQEGFESGNYPLVDVFLNAKLNRFHAFVRLEHAAYGVLQQPYYYLPRYPYQGRAVVFGVRWSFFD